MRSNFKKYGKMRVRFETPEERSEIIRILEEQRGFRFDDDLKRRKDIPSWDNRTFDLDLKFKTYEYCLQPFIGAAMMSSGVRFYSAQEFFRIAELGFRVVPRFPVFHVPHDGREFPEDLMDSVCVPREVFLRYHEKMRDTDISRAVPEAYRGGHMYQAFRISRLLCDVERFIGPEEVMERYGMGLCYERVYDGAVIKHVTEEARERALRYYREHHARMDMLCERHPRILLFDLHSYSDEIVPKDFLWEGAPLPDLCIGTDERVTPPKLLEIIKRRYSEAGFSIAVNFPYRGCFIPDTVLNGKSDTDCAAIMLEVNKRTYCDREGNPVPEKLERLSKINRQIVVDCVDLD